MKMFSIQNMSKKVTEITWLHVNSFYASMIAGWVIAV